MRIATCLLIAVVATGCASTRTASAPVGPGALPSEGPVSVRWSDPMQFDEVRHAPGSVSRDVMRGDWLPTLAKHLRDRTAKQLAPGQRADIEIVNVDLAGGYEPWLGPWYQDVRIIRDIYPPRMTVRYTLRDAAGATLDSGERKITDLAFSSGSTPLDQDSLRYEKRMIDAWVRRQFPRDIAAR